MPYVSKAQAGKFFAMERRGELPKGTARRWAHETPGGIASLPRRKRRIRTRKDLEGHVHRLLDGMGHGK